VPVGADDSASEVRELVDSVGSGVSLLLGVLVESVGGDDSTIESDGSLLEVDEGNTVDSVGSSELDGGTLVESVGTTVDAVGTSVLDDGTLVE